MNKFQQFYSYDTNKDLIIKLCKKFRLKEPILQANCYGSVDIVFSNNLKIYNVQVEYNKVILKCRSNRDFGKSTKEHMRIIKEYTDGNIWYDIVKKISKDSEIL